jgi:regulator of RNase E activity RraA
MQKSTVSTADIYDAHSQGVQVCEPTFRDFSNKTDFTGPIRTLKVFECPSSRSAVKLVTHLVGLVLAL